MQPIGIPFIVVSGFWFLIGGVAPFLVWGPNKELIRVMLTISSVCCYMFWLCTILHQLNPLIGPQLSNETAHALQYLWGNSF